MWNWIKHLKSNIYKLAEKNETDIYTSNNYCTGTAANGWKKLPSNIHLLTQGFVHFGNYCEEYYQITESSVARMLSGSANSTPKQWDLCVVCF